MSDLYETLYNIHNQISSAVRPMSSVAFHSAEDYTNGSLLEGAIDDYVSKSIKDLYGLSLPEYLALPRDVIELLTKVGSKKIAEKNRDIENMNRQLEGK